MIPGTTAAAGTTAIAMLPVDLSSATINPLQALLADPYARRTYLLEATPRDTVADAAVNVRLSSDGYATFPGDSPASTGYKGRLISPYNAQVSVLRNGRPGGGGIPTFGALVAGNMSVRAADGTVSGELDHLGDYAWTGHDLSILVGGPTFPRADFGTIFSGTSEGLNKTFSAWELQLRGYEFRVQKDIQRTLYKGLGPCIRLDGVDDVGSATVNCPAGSMTVECFGMTTTSAAAVRCFAGWQNASAAGERLLKTLASGTNRLAFRVRNDAGTSFDAVYDSLVVGQRYHFAGVLDTAAGKVRLYVDGELAQETSVSGTFATVLTAFAVGRRPDAASEYLTGEEDEFRVWSTARTQAEIRASMGGELLGTETGLVYYNKANDASGTTATATVGNNLTLAGGVTWVHSLEGGAELAGKCKPKGRGQVRDFEAVLVDPLNLIYQFSDRGSDSVQAIKDKGLALTAAGDVADLFTTSVTAGQYKTDLSRSLFRLGAKPAGRITVDFKGDNTGAGYVSTAADIVRRILEDDLGFDSGTELDLGAFSRANIANSAVHGYATRLEPEQADVVITRLLDSIGAPWTFTRPGLFTLFVVTDPAAAAIVGTLTANGIMEDGLREEVAPQPSRTTRAGYMRVWTTQQASELATTLSADEIQRLGEGLQFVEAPAPAVLDDYPEAGELVVETYMDTRADAQAEATRQQAIYGTPRQIIHARLVQGLHLWNIGDAIYVEPLSKNMLVCGWIEDVPDNIELVLWG